MLVGSSFSEVVCLLGRVFALPRRVLFKRRARVQSRYGPPRPLPLGGPFGADLTGSGPGATESRPPREGAPVGRLAFTVGISPYIRRLREWVGHDGALPEFTIALLGDPAVAILGHGGAQRIGS